MSSAPGTSNNGGSNGSPYSAELVEEIRRFNAGLTQAGQKPRPGRGRGTAARGGNRALGPMRLTPQPVRPRGTGKAIGTKDRYEIQKPSSVLKTSNFVPHHLAHISKPGQAVISTAPHLRTFEAANTVPPHLAHMSGFVQKVPKIPQAELASNWNDKTRFRLPAEIDSQVSTAPPPWKPAANSSIPCPDDLPPPWTPAVGTANKAVKECTGTTAGYTSPRHKGRQLITFTTESVIGKDVPDYIKQYDASKAIKEMSDLTGIPYEIMTRDGHSIPGGKPTAFTTPPPSILIPASVGQDLVAPPAASYANFTAPRHGFANSGSCGPIISEEAFFAGLKSMISENQKAPAAESFEDTMDIDMDGNQVNSWGGYAGSLGPVRPMPDPVQLKLQVKTLADSIYATTPTTATTAVSTKKQNKDWFKAEQAAKDSKTASNQPSANSWAFDASPPPYRPLPANAPHSFQPSLKNWNAGQVSPAPPPVAIKSSEQALNHPASMVPKNTPGTKYLKDSMWAD